VQNPNFLEEFRASAIPERLALANAVWTDGDTAVQLLTEHAIAASQKGSSFVGMPARRILNKYAFAADGGWLLAVVPTAHPLQCRISSLYTLAKRLSSEGSVKLQNLRPSNMRHRRA